MIASLEAFDENYVEAWELLKARYDNTKAIKQKHINYSNLPKLVKEDHVALRRLLDMTMKPFADELVGSKNKLSMRSALL